VQAKKFICPGHYGPEIQTVARELFWRGRLSGIDIGVLIGGGWTPPRSA
jgi:hypothetical protein